MARPPAATGSCAAVSTRRAKTRCRSGARKIRPGSASIPTGPSPGRSTGGSSTTAPPAISKANPTIRRESSWSGSATNGSAMFPMVPGRRMANKEKGKYPFIMKADGVGALFGPGMVEGPFPEHYEPLEGPLAKNPLSRSADQSDRSTIFKSDLDKVANADAEVPLCLHHLLLHRALVLRLHPLAAMAAGGDARGLSRDQRDSWPENWVSRTARRSRFPRSGARLQCVAMVTKRMTPFEVEGKTVHRGRHSVQLRLALPGRRA